MSDRHERTLMNFTPATVARPMPNRRARRMTAVLCIAAAGLTMSTASASASTLLRLNGIGPVKIGMLRTAALGTGWLSDRSTGCKLGGTPYPIGYRLHGPSAPSGLVGNVESRSGHVRNIVVTRNARTAVGVTVRKTTFAGMVTRYRNAGYTATAAFDSTFQGTFVTVKKAGKTVITGFGSGQKVTSLGVPYIPVCE